MNIKQVFLFIINLLLKLPTILRNEAGYWLLIDDIHRFKEKIQAEYELTKCNVF